MTASSVLRISRTESHRWSTDLVVILTLIFLVGVCAVLTYFAVLVAAGGTSSDGTGVQLQTDMVLNSNSTAGQVASMAQSSLSMLVPIAAIVLGVRAAGSEMASGALLQLAVAARSLRLVFFVRSLIVALTCGLTAALAAMATLGATHLAILQVPHLEHLSTWDHAGSMIAGATAQGIMVGLLAFSLSALTRRWVVVLVGMIVYLVAIEPILATLVGKANSWLPRAATSSLMLPAPELLHVLPTFAAAMVLVTLSITSLHRSRAAR